MAYEHGITVLEKGTATTAAITGTSGLQVVVGTAPVNMVAYNATKSGVVNVPILANTYKEAVQQLGYSDEFKSYTLCMEMYHTFQVEGAGPIVLINVLDPAKHKSAFSETTLTLTNTMATLNEKGVLTSTLTVKSGTTALDAGDYTTEFNDDGTLEITVTKKGVSTITVSGEKLDPSMVTAKDIVGGLDSATGEETGIEAVRKVYPKLGMTPGIILAPYWSKDATVCAALQAKVTTMNGCFRVFFCADIDSSDTGATKYTDVKSQKEKQGLNSAYGAAGWLWGKVGDYLIAPSVVMAAKLAYVDASLGDVPYDGLDNQTVSISAACLEDGTEVLLDQEQASEVNGYGVCTLLNMNGWRLWGNNTCAYPSNTDPKDRWISIRRFMSWAANTFILTYFQKLGRPVNTRFIQDIVQSENIRGNSFVARDICAKYSIAYDEDSSDLANGKVAFYQYMSPYPPAENIVDTIEYDLTAVTEALASA